MNTLEDRITKTLSKHADEVGSSRRSADMVLARSTHATTKHRRLRIAVASMAACSLLGTGVGVWKLSDHRPGRSDTVASENGVYPLRLKPTWLPEGVSPVIALHNDGDVEQQGWSGGAGYTALWSAEKGFVIVSTYLFPPGIDVSNDVKTVAIEKWEKRKAGTRSFLTWSDSTGAQGASVSLSASGAVADAQVRAVAESISISVGGRIVVNNQVDGLVNRFSLRDKEVLGENRWSWYSPYDYGSAPTVRAQIPTEWSKVLEAAMKSSADAVPTVPVQIRGVTGQLSNANTTYSPNAGQEVTIAWKEHGWELVVQAKDQATAIKFADGLEQVDADTWAQQIARDRPTQFGGGRPRVDREVATSDRGSLRIDFGSGESAAIGVVTAEIVTANNCFNAEFTIDNRKVKYCIPITKEKVMWTATERVGDRKVLIAAVNETVDAVVPTSADSPVPNGVISSLTVNDTGVDTMSIDTDDGGAFTKLGLVVVALDDSVSALDLFKAEPPSPNDAPDDGTSVWPESVPVEGVQTEDDGQEFDSTLTPLGRYVIKK
jgi:hypothetical protein